MRDFNLCKAKDIETKEWVEGYYFYDDVYDTHLIIRSWNGAYSTTDARFWFHIILPETVCRLVKTLDDDEKLWEGDIIKCKHKSGIEFIGEVVFDKSTLAFGLKTFSKELNSFIFRPFYEYEFSDIKILGNKFDNPDLLEGER